MFDEFNDDMVNAWETRYAMLIEDTANAVSAMIEQQIMELLRPVGEI